MKAPLISALAFCVCIAVLHPAFSQSQEDNLPSNSYIDIRPCITPNGDGINEYLTFSTPRAFCLEVYDRFGKVLYENGDYQNDWPTADVKPEHLPNGTYFFRLTLYKPDKSDPLEYIGDFQVLR